MAAALVGRSITSQCLRGVCRGQYAAPLVRRAVVQPTVRSFSARGQVLEKKYTEDHEWIELDSDGKIGTLGISEYAAKALGDVVYVELPTVDQEIAAGDSIGAVESVKSASDILTPVSGKVVEANNVLEDTPATVNKSPEADGWFAKIEISNKAELEGLMDAQAYKQFTDEEGK